MFLTKTKISPTIYALLFTIFWLKNEDKVTDKIKNTQDIKIYVIYLSDMLRMAVKPSATSFTFTFHLKNTIQKHLQHQMQKHDKMQNSLSKRIMKLYFKSNYSRLMFMSIANPFRSCTEKTHKYFKNSKTAFLDLKVTFWLGSTKVNIFLPEARTCSM